MFVGLSNYREYFSDQTLVISFSNMLFLTSFALAMTIVVPLTVARIAAEESVLRAAFAPYADYARRVPALVPLVGAR